MTMRYKSMVPPARRQAISCVPLPPPLEEAVDEGRQAEVNSPMVEAMIDPACFNRMSRSFIDAAEVIDVILIIRSVVVLREEGLLAVALERRGARYR